MRRVSSHGGSARGVRGRHKSRTEVPGRGQAFYGRRPMRARSCRSMFPLRNRYRRNTRSPPAMLLAPVPFSQMNPVTWPADSAERESANGSGTAARNILAICRYLVTAVGRRLRSAVR